MTDREAIAAAAALLRGAGYLVAKIPDCTRPAGHGSHPLITRTARCPGVEPIPHGYHSSFDGSFGTLVNCLCGASFATYSFVPDEAAPWDQHQAEHPPASEPA